jgi:hypothetical protein
LEERESKIKEEYNQLKQDQSEFKALKQMVDRGPQIKRLPVPIMKVDQKKEEELNKK